MTRLFSFVAFPSVKIAADVHGIVEQRWRGSDGGRSSKAEKTGGGKSVERNHVGFNVFLTAIVLISITETVLSVLSLK